MSNLCQAPARLLRTKRRGQAVLEYILLMAVVFVSSTVMISFIRNGLFGAGLQELPQKVAVCLSHRSRAAFGGVRCQ